MAHRSHWKLITVFSVIILYILLVSLPYLLQGGVSADTEAAFDLSSFYSEEPSGEMARILFTNEDALETRLQLINNAEERIILSTFYFHVDGSGRQVLSALYSAAERGVEIYLIEDGSSIHSLRDKAYFSVLGSFENVEIKVYNPMSPFRPHKLMARLHDKYLIVDEKAYILGGRNIADYFLGATAGKRNHDWDVLVYNEEASSDSSLHLLLDYFESVWSLEESRTRYERVPLLIRGLIRRAEAELMKIAAESSVTEHIQPDWSQTVPVNSIVLLSNPVEAKVKEPVLFYNMTELMLQSGEAVAFHTPYILCNEYMLERLSLLCAKLPVTMMTNSVANNGNIFGAADYRIFRSSLLETGLKILEYDSGVSYHGKCFTIGERLSGIGSFNWDMRSAYIDTELMLVIDSAELNSEMRSYMAEYESTALEVLPDGSYGEGRVPSALTLGRKLILSLMNPVTRVFRFLF